MKKAILAALILALLNQPCRADSFSNDGAYLDGIEDGKAQAQKDAEYNAEVESVINPPPDTYELNSLRRQVQQDQRTIQLLEAQLKGCQSKPQ